jgi:energy-coupling factor transport system substrate-specific component
MSWQLGSFALLAAGLIAGFAWYERTKPDARIVALVGTLAAFGALGRIAFAAIPNVKPTGDIVLIAGFALGGAPGYVVGAVAALTSNFFFGQGPWTPWQMAAWGLTGVAGALLARGTRGRIGRVSLAAICFVLGFAFTAFQDVSNWVMYSDHSLAQLGVYVSSGLGFDLISGCGCFAFALAFGPAMIRALRRFRKRLHVTWLPTASGSTAAMALITIALGVGLASAEPSRAAGATTATGYPSNPVEYLFAAENRDGGVGMAPDQPSSSMVSAWQTMALAVSGIDPFTHAKSGGRGAVSYLVATVGQDTDPGAIERAIIAISLVRQRFPLAPNAPSTAVRATDVGGVDLLARLRRDFKRDGSVADQSNLTAFGILALRAANAAVPARAVTWLAHQQDRDGGFNYSTGGAISDVDDTGAVLEALAGTGHDAVIRRAVSFIRGQQNRDGGFPADAGGVSNAQSTAFAVQGLIAAGVTPMSVRRGHSRSPLGYLRSLIQPDGAVDYAKGVVQTPVWVTAQAELALAGSVL